MIPDDHTKLNKPARLVLPHLDPWIASLFDPETRSVTIEQLLTASGADHGVEEARLLGLRRAIKKAETDLARFKSLIAGGADETEIVKWINEAVAAKRQAEAELAAAARASSPITAESLREMLDAVGDLGELPATASPSDRKALYQDLGLELTYDPITKVIHARQDLGPMASGWGHSRVGGGT